MRDIWGLGVERGGFLVGIWMVFWGWWMGSVVVVVSICLSILWLVARGDCFTYAQYDEKAFVSAHSYIYKLNDQPLRHHHSLPTKSTLTNKKKKKEKKKIKKTHSNPPPSNQTPPHHRPTFPQSKSIHPSIHFTTSPPSAPPSTPSSPPPSSPTPPPSASADPPQTESIHPAYTSQYAYLHH